MNARIQTIVTGILLAVTIVFCSSGKAQSPLYLPDTLAGNNFNLEVQAGQKSFFPGKITNTYGYNGSFLGPTLFINQGDSITLNVKNQLNVATTVHWHGFHVAPEHDGGPHQLIPPGATWSPRFKMLNEAATFWYHPHGEGKTEIQVTRGLAGMIIVRDQAEAALALPRKYGVDDFPLIVQSKAFDVFYGFETATHNDSITMVNGTIDPYLEVPRQVVRLRLLNGSSERTFLFGLANNNSFSIIGTDGGLLAAPVSATRVHLSPGERVELLVDFGKFNTGDSIDLKSFASELATGIIGADSVGNPQITMGEEYYNNPLNGADFTVLRFKIKAATANPITSIPGQLVSRSPISTPVNEHRTLTFIPDTVQSGQEGYVDGPFYINNQPFHMDSVNQVVYLNNTEIWTLENKTLIAHPFHIHDVQFNVTEINGQEPPAEYKGLKDVILVKPFETVRFITRFEHFSNDHVPYMFHCHLLHHEDEGMMGAFVVRDTSGTGQVNEINQSGIRIFPVPASDLLNIDLADAGRIICISDVLGSVVWEQTTDKLGITSINTEPWPNGTYLIRVIEPVSGQQVVKKILKMK